MSGIRGNVAWFAAQQQSAKGTVATYAAAKAVKNAFAGGNIGPTRETDNLSETDSSRDRGVTFVKSGAIEGSPELYVRDTTIAFWLKMALGACASSGTTNYTHSITPANNLPYFTAAKNLGDTLYETYKDCKVDSLSIKAEAGMPLSATVGIKGCGDGVAATRTAAAWDNSSPIAVDSDLVYNYNLGTVTLGGSATAMVRSFELNINNNVVVQQTDSVVPLDVYEGTREVSLSFDLIFDTLDEYNKFHYGGAAGTIVSPNVFTTSAIFDFAGSSVNNNINFSLPSIAYTEFPIEPSPGGDAVVASVAAAAQRSGSPVLTATVLNQRATYVA